ncbi:MAG: ATP-binding cassette domain-containing protein [Candidatus Hydrogenedentota bacterium]
MTSSNNGTSPAAVVRLDGVRVEYGAACALVAPALVIAPGEKVFVLGKSGSGKTTLAKVIKGRLRPSSGNAFVLGKDPMSLDLRTRRAVQRRVAMIDQEFYLVPRMSVVANVLSGALGRVGQWRSLLGWYPTEEWQKADAILKEVELDGFGGRRVETLSGGQRQRTAIARALMQEADVILADEPVSNLDPELAEDALELLVQCTQRRGVTLIVNLHQPRLASRYATRVLGLSRGSIVFDGPPSALTATGEEFIYVADAPTPSAAVPGQPYHHDRPATALAR